MSTLISGSADSGEETLVIKIIEKTKRLLNAFLENGSVVRVAAKPTESQPNWFCSFVQSKPSLSYLGNPKG